MDIFEEFICIMACKNRTKVKWPFKKNKCVKIPIGYLVDCFESMGWKVKEFDKLCQIKCHFLTDYESNWGDIWIKKEVF